MGLKGAIWSSAAMGILLNEGIGDTIRISLTPRARRRSPRRGLRRLRIAAGARACAPSLPSVTACPGCGRTTSTTFQELAESIQGYVRDKMPEWKTAVRGRRDP